MDGIFQIDKQLFQKSTKEQSIRKQIDFSCHTLLFAPQNSNPYAFMQNAMDSFWWLHYVSHKIYNQFACILTLHYCTKRD